MKTHSSVPNLVFYLLEDDSCVGTEPVAGYAADYQELVLDEQTPRFRSHALSAGCLGLDAGFTLTAQRKTPFFAAPERLFGSLRDPKSRREAELLRDWCTASDRPLLAYQLEIGNNDFSLGRVDDVPHFWEEATAAEQRDALGQSAAFVARWLMQNRPLEPGEEETALLSELIAATRGNLPFYAHVFEQLVCGKRGIAGLSEAQHIRLGDYTCKMFLRFPSYLLRRCLARATDAELQRRAYYLDSLTAAFVYNLAPLSLDEFCDYLSAKADCLPQSRVDLAWFIGELSQAGQAHAGRTLLSA